MIRAKHISISDLKAMVADHQAARTAAQHRRAYWKETLLPAIETRFLDLGHELGLDVTVEVLSELDGLATVMVKINDYHSGIFEMKEVGPSELVRHPGTLAYSQTLNGTIRISHIPPFLEGLMEEPEARALETLFPEDLSTQRMDHHFGQYLESLIDWECQTNNGNTIGYKTQQPPPNQKPSTTL